MCSSAPSPPAPDRFLFSGRTGPPPRRLGWSPVPPGNFGKEMDRNETRFWKSPPGGPGEGTDRNGFPSKRTLLDVISSADWIIDMGPEGGNKGGQIIFEGTPKELLGAKQSLTSKYLKQ